MNRYQIQKAGALPSAIEPGMQLVLGELGVVATVMTVDVGIVRTAGAALQRPTSCGFAADGSMSLERALACELACDWDPAWERADYYACDDDPDELDGISPEGAISEHFRNAPLDADPEQWIRAVSPLEVTAYRRAVVSDAWLTNMASELVELFEENYALEYGAHPHRRPFDDNKHEFRPELITKVQAVLAEAVARAQPYDCSAVASKLYSATEVERILIADGVDWFDESAAQDTTFNVVGL